MKSFLRFACLLAVVCGTLGESTQSYKDVVGPLAKDCMDGVEATEDDFQAVLQRNSLETRPAKCLLACVYEKLGAFTPDGDIVKEDDLMPLMDRVYSFKEFETVKKTQVVHNCIMEVNGSHPDRCELVKIFLDCVRQYY